jgi:hypothetical protein
MAPARSYEVEVEPTGPVDADRWKWILIVDRKEVDFGEVTGGRDTARFAGIAAHTRYLEKMPGKQPPRKK